ncbi:MAG: trigger factor [Xanthomonadales bacterium]|nr:Trigger factor [Xanthomonadales bacterium]MCC6593994.1 trigger factor [Xanthomonadales bacterium]MCE7930232.1 trigger factor [Xanthomonadales bacterium PRO6]
MQVSVEKLDDFARRLKISVSGERFRQGIHARIRELSKTVHLNGFRHGKVPALVIEKRFGAQIRDEVTQNLIRETLAEAVREQKLRPAHVPNVVRDSDVTNEFAYTATFDVMPEFPVIEVADLRVVREVAEVTDADVERMIDTLRRQRMSFHPVERAAGAGDYVAFEFVIAAGDLRIPEEGAERGLTAIGQKQVLPQIEEGLVGLCAEQSRSVQADFPADYRDERLAGKSTSIEIKVLRVNEARLPEVDDAFAGSFNIPGGIDSFRREVRANLERELGQALSARLRGVVVEQLLTKYGELGVPNSLVTEEARTLQRQAVAEMTERAKRAGQPVPPEPALESLREMARRRVLAAMLLNEIATKNGLRLDEGRVRTALAAIASTYEDPSEVVQMYQQDQRLMNGLRARVMDEQVAEWVAGHCQVTEQSRSFQEVLQPGAKPVT